MASATMHVARKSRPCGFDYRGRGCEIRAGELYVRSVAFPGDEGHEEGTKPWVIEVCAGCGDERGAGVRAQYGVPARFGARITVDGEPAVIAGFYAASLLVRLDGQRHLAICHPTAGVDYGQVA